MTQKSLAETARLVRWVAIAALLLLVGAFAAYRLGLDLGPSVEVRGKSAEAPDHAAWGADLAALLFAIALVQLIRLLGRLGMGEMFAPSVTGAVRSFAFWLMLSAIVAIVAPPLIGLIGGLGGSAHRIEIRLDLRDVMFVIAALVLFLLARMLDEAARLDRELKEFV